MGFFSGEMATEKFIRDTSGPFMVKTRSPGAEITGFSASLIAGLITCN
jgi:hypothetical protein